MEYYKTLPHYSIFGNNFGVYIFMFQHDNALESKEKLQNIKQNNNNNADRLWLFVLNVCQFLTRDRIKQFDLFFYAMLAGVVGKSMEQYKRLTKL